VEQRFKMLTHLGSCEGKTAGGGPVRKKRKDYCGGRSIKKTLLIDAGDNRMGGGQPKGYVQGGMAEGRVTHLKCHRRDRTTWRSQRRGFHNNAGENITQKQVAGGGGEKVGLSFERKVRTGKKDISREKKELVSRDYEEKLQTKCRDNRTGPHRKKPSHGPERKNSKQARTRYGTSFRRRKDETKKTRNYKRNPEQEPR